MFCPLFCFAHLFILYSLSIAPFRSSVSYFLSRCVQCISLLRFPSVRPPVPPSVLPSVRASVSGEFHWRILKNIYPYTLASHWYIHASITSTPTITAITATAASHLNCGLNHHVRCGRTVINLLNLFYSWF